MCVNYGLIVLERTYPCWLQTTLWVNSLLYCQISPKMVLHGHVEVLSSFPVLASQTSEDGYSSAIVFMRIMTKSAEWYNSVSLSYKPPLFTWTIL